MDNQIISNEDLEFFTLDADLLERLIKDKEYEPEYYQRKERWYKLYAHAYGNVDMLMDLIVTAFPSEPAEILEYRKSILFPITESYFTKILNSVSIIRNSKSFNIVLPEELENFIAKDGDGLEDLTNYYFNNLFMPCLVDANAFIIVLPNKGKFVWTVDVIYRDEDTLFVKDGEEYYEYNRRGVYKYTYNGDTNKVDIQVVMMFPNAVAKYWFQVGGEPVTVNDTDKIYKSYFSGVVPFWDDAIVEYCDKKCGVKQHLFPTMWTTSSNKCKTCDGRGSVIYEAADYSKHSTSCGSCGGVGYLPTGTFKTIVVETGSLTAEKGTIPPAGYIQKDFSAIEFLNEDLKQNILDGLASVNMENLFQVPLNQSGVAKDVDRREYYGLLNKLIDFSVNIINKILKIETFWYIYLLQPLEDLGEVMEIPDDLVVRLISINDVKDLLTQSTVSISDRENKLQYIEDNISDKDSKNIAKLITILDPLQQYKTEEKISLFNAGAVSADDLYLSVNIELLIRVLYEQGQIDVTNDFNTNFTKLLEYAKEKRTKTLL